MHIRILVYLLNRFGQEAHQKEDRISTLLETDWGKVS